MDFDFRFMIMTMIEMAMTTWNCLWTLNLAPKAVNFYFTACLIFHQMCKNLLFSTCILSSDFQLTSPHDFHYFNCKLFIDKIYLLLFTCIYILIRYLPVHCNCLINRHFHLSVDSDADTYADCFAYLF